MFWRRPGPLALGALQRLEEEIDHLVVKTKRSEGSRGQQTTIQIDEASHVEIDTLFGSPQIRLGVYSDNPKLLSRIDADLVWEWYQTHVLAEVARELGLTEDRDAISMIYQVVAERGMLSRGGEQPVYDCVSDKPDRIWRVPGTNLTLHVEIDPKAHGVDAIHVHVEANGRGCLKVDARQLNFALSRHKQSRLETAFRTRSSAPVAMPTFLGNARASRLTVLARRALLIDKDLVDSHGNRVQPLIDEHLPRLVKRHRDAVALSATSDIPSVDAELEQSLDAIARSIGQALDAVRTDARDALRAEIRFLESRNPNNSI